MKMFSRGSSIVAAVLGLLFPAWVSAATQMRVDTVLLPSDPAPEGIFRWSEGSTLNLDGDRHLLMVVTALGQGGHDDTPGKILEFHSHDGGLTWTPPDEATVWQENIGARNVMSPSLLRLDNGDILGFFLVTDAALKDGGPWMKRSTDNGKTWSEPVRMAYEGYGGPGNDRAIQISSGRILLPCWVSLDELASAHTYVLYSDDCGATWQKTALISVPKGSTGRKTDPAAEEPMIIELNSGRLMMIMRTYLKSIWVTYSDDQGETWTEPQASGIPAPGSMSTIKRMPSGGILLIWNWAPEDKIDGPWPRNYISAAVSTDDGKTFSWVRHLDGSDDFPGKITMANVCFTGNDAVITYSRSMTQKNAYDWRLQVVPMEWFFEGDRNRVYEVAQPDSPPPEVRGEPPSPRRIGATHQLMLDGSLITQMDGLDLVVNQAVTYHANPVLTYTKPWEANCVTMYGSVLYDVEEERFKAWYMVYKKLPPPDDEFIVFCYATSKDGFSWEKPALGLFDVDGSAENNVVMTGHFDAPTVFRNPRDNGARKYLMAWYDKTVIGIRVSSSPDGIHWNHPDRVAVASGDRSTAGYDPLRGKFYVITRVWRSKHRTCALWESDDGECFEFVREIAAADEDDPEGTEFYGMVRFPWAGLHVGVIEMFYIPQRKLNAQLAYSHDGLHWHRAGDREAFVDWGPPGAWDRAWVCPSHNPPIQVGDTLYIFYQGRQTLHWSVLPFGIIGSVGLAFLRPDGFVSLEPEEPLDRSNTTHAHQGTATTVPLLLEGESLHVNALARPGSIRVEVLDSDGASIDGFTREDARPLRMADSLDAVVAWERGRTLKELSGKPVLLRFHIQAAKLYSFWVE